MDNGSLISRFVAVVTGSFAYGNPHADSDLDLVVLVNAGDLDLLREMSDHPDDFDSPDEEASAVENSHKRASLRFGKLNLICETDPNSFRAWRDATKKLTDMSTEHIVSRDEAIRVIDEFRKQHGVKALS